VISWFQAFAFKWVNLYRYSSVEDLKKKAHSAEEDLDEAGLRTLTPHDPQLKGAWFQTLTLEHQSWFQVVPFKMQLAPLRRGAIRRQRYPDRQKEEEEEKEEKEKGGDAGGHDSAGRGGAVQLLNSVCP
jgi:hypothetical protein